jgi:hypothetical protein
MPNVILEAPRDRNSMRARATISPRVVHENLRTRWRRKLGSNVLVPSGNFFEGHILMFGSVDRKLVVLVVKFAQCR